jgi:hypothetical protein
MYWIKNTDGKRDAMLTFALVAFLVVTFNILVATFGSIIYRDINISFQAMDAATMSAYLAATFTAYVSRRWTDKKYPPSNDEQEGGEE